MDFLHLLFLFTGCRPSPQENPEMNFAFASVKRGLSPARGRKNRPTGMPSGRAGFAHAVRVNR
jgi:hypothetical protein